MSVYLVALDEPNKAVWDILKEKWPDRQHYIVNDRLAFVAPTPTPGQVLITEDICDVLGFGPDEQVLGIVSQVSDAINGWHEGSFWEWLAKVPK